MDALDMKIRIEKRFDVKLTQDDFSDLLSDGDMTVGDLYEFLLKKLQLRDVGRYAYRLNADFWLQMQQILSSVTLIPLDHIELRTPLKELFPQSSLRDTWANLRENCPYRIRELDYSPWIRRFSFLLAAGIVLIEQFQLWQVPALRVFWLLLGIFGVWMFAETYFKVLSVLSHWRNRLPSGLTTVKDLCRTVFAANYADICREAEVQLDEQCLTVWNELTEILVDTLGIEPDEVTFRSRLVQDLGME